MKQTAVREDKQMETAETPAPDAAQGVKLPYTLKTWMGLPLYCCPECAFDALEEETILFHIAEHMARRESRLATATVFVADKNGNMIGG
jgi:hypothetical protein